LFVARIADGAVLADAAEVYVGDDENRRYFRPGQLDGLSVRDDFTDLSVSLAGTRLIGWDRTAEAMLVAMRRRGVAGLDGVDLADGNLFGARYSRWLGLPAWDRAAYAHQSPDLLGVAPPAAGSDRFAEAVVVLREMAAGDPAPERLDAARARRHRNYEVRTPFRPHSSNLD
jgi:hypothetical protein